MNSFRGSSQWDRLLWSGHWWLVYSFAEVSSVRAEKAIGRKGRKKGQPLGFEAIFWDYLTCRQGKNWAASHTDYNDIFKKKTCKILRRLSGTHFILWLFLVMDIFNPRASGYLYSTLREVTNSNNKKRQ